MHSKALTQGLGEMLQAALPLAEPLDVVTAVQPILTIGDEHRYGHVAVLEVATGQPASQAAHRPGLVVGHRQGDAVGSASQAWGLRHRSDPARFAPVVLVYAQENGQPDRGAAADDAQVWDAEDAGRRVSLRPVDRAELRQCLAWPVWRRELLQQDGAVAGPAIRQFVHEHCAAVLGLLRPLPVGG